VHIERLALKSFGFATMFYKIVVHKLSEAKQQEFQHFPLLFVFAYAVFFSRAIVQ